MRTRTLANLRADVREWSDMLTSTFISDANMNERLNKSIALLYGKLVAVRGPDYYEKQASFSTTAAKSLYDLSADMTPTASDFWQLIQVEITDGTFKRAVQPFMRKEGPRWQEYPVPAGYSFNLLYVPAPTRLVNDSDVFDGIAGFEDWAVLDTVIGALAKEENDVSVYMNERAKWQEAIDALASDRDAGWPERIVDVSRRTSPILYNGGVPRYRLRGATGIDGAGQKLEILWGPMPGAWAW